MTDTDLIELQYMAARYANDRATYAADTINNITVRLIKRSVFPQPDHTRGAPEPTVWAKDRHYGWPMDLVEAYGWDGKKVRKVAEKSTRDMSRNELMAYVEEMRQTLNAVARSTRTDTIMQGDTHDPQAGQQVCGQKRGRKDAGNARNKGKGS